MPKTSAPDKTKAGFFFRAVILLYGIFAYLMFIGVTIYAVGFLGNIMVPNSLDALPMAPVGTALLIDAGLIALFGLQHSIMARPGFKKGWTKIIPPAAERSTYILFSNLALIVLFYYWEPIGGEIWNLNDSWAYTVLMAAFFSGWVVLSYATALIDSMDMFGLRQVWLHFKGKPYTPPNFSTRGLYKFCRHPIYLGWLMVFWCTPVMTSAHLLFAVLSTLYILIAVRFEERDLINDIGPEYTRYRDTVRMILPLPRRR